ncbi:LysR family glycine cleavage system transcriptional activator [Methylobacterium brachiatum]|jgi:LysR family glycine cleavage system transcriptional activator|uniref:LysR family glycine cleavage system transcriptional activator n=1 Tax=Methylobacterium brachiatum TaxID=269660 RepID=A0AAJ1TSZ5_9HYPH|nr:transcriptional regulator GcvA [Methylobacterium brachiatum]MCB4805555.1 transcriptional regulator GcvA [Methylobacterium brachiatum]MDQ0546607.1 LysR family glycine cleavage system transcriptional activator [Methylobacterium brachiatum]
MHRRLPPLNALKAFEAAARHASFTRAAEELRVTHGAVSRHVQMLEGWLGVPLFERHNRRVVLTEAGRSYAAEIGAALDRVALATARQVERGRPRLLHVNALATFTLRWLIPRLSGFQVAHPAIEVRLTTSNVPLANLADPFDVAIRGGPQTRPGHVAQPFLTERRIPVCSPALLQRLPLQEPGQLRHHTLLHAATLPEVWPHWLRAAGVPDLVPQASVTLEHFYLTLQAALDGLGVAMGPERLIADDLAAGRLTRPFAGPSLPARSYYTYVPEARAEDPTVRAFCAWLTEAAHEA